MTNFCQIAVNAKPLNFVKGLKGFNNVKRSFNFAWNQIWELLPHNPNCVRGKFNAIDLRNIKFD